jgi:hypothetical protein
MKYWFIVFEWWELPRVRENLIENVIWEGNHPIDFLIIQRTTARVRSKLPGNNLQDYRLLWWSEIDADTFWKNKGTGELE